MSSLSRPSRLAVIGCPVGALFLLAALVPGCPLAAEEPPRQREAPLELLPIEHCRKLAQDWASWIREPLIYDPGGTRKHIESLSATYSFLTPSGKDRVEVDALLGETFTWTNLPATAEATEEAAGSATSATGTAAKRSEVAQRFMEQYLRGVSEAQYVPVGTDLWAVCVSRRWVGTVVVRGDDRTGQVRYANQWKPAIEPAVAPAVAPDQAAQAARNALADAMPSYVVLGLEPFTRAAGIEAGSVEALTDMPDRLGMRRLAYGFNADLARRLTRPNRERGTTGGRGRAETRLVLLRVDAQTGEVYPSLDAPGAWIDEIQGERLPHLRLGQKATFDPAFPAKIRDGKPYLYVGYLGSAIWRGQVSGKKDDSAVVEYRGQTWHLRAGNETVAAGTRSIKASHCPLLIGERLYLPPEILQAITGWHMTYVPKENTVYLYTLGPDPVPAPGD
jgi:hypothetical protein